MLSCHSKTINFLLILCVFFVHIFIGSINLSDLPQDSISERVKIKLKDQRNVRKIGNQKSKIKKYEAIPSKENQGLRNFAIKPNQGIIKTLQAKKVTSSHPKGKRTKNKQTEKKIDFVQKQIVQEAVSEKRIRNPLLDKVNYNVKFIPPKGISPEKLNEFEKVFYSFFKRVALKYIDSINSTVLTAVDDKPYIKDILKKHKPALLTAMVRYDKNGNAEVIKILKSSHSDEIHQLFEEALKKMNKIPNITKTLQDEDGKYTAFFQLGINNFRQ